MMGEPAAIVAVLLAVAAVLAALLIWAETRLPVNEAPLVDAIDALLPQTQCAQCGYPGCRPYAQAVAGGEALNLCPPGGEETQRALSRLLDRPPGPPPGEPPPQVARIDEAACIGCFRCVEACPVDAIVGAPQLMHTVLEERCTGCGLCLPPCPVDCIRMDEVAVPVAARPLKILARPRNREPEAPELACIRCGACQDECPENLLPQELYWYAAAGAVDEAAQRGLDACIECGRCNQACPSNIDLLAAFTRGRQALASRAAADREAADARRRYQAHEQRKEARGRAWESRRRARLETGGDRPWLR